MKYFKFIIIVSYLFFAITACKKETKKSIIVDLQESTIISENNASLTTVYESRKSSISNSNIVDYRQFQTTVKNQGYRGTCTAFSIASILEILPGVPADVSEQYLYGALKHSQPNKTFSEGDYLRNYIKSLNEYGFIHESKLPYNYNKIKWNDSDSQFTKLIRGTHLGKVSLYLLKSYAKYSLTRTNQFQYFEYKDASNPEQIKQLLDNGIKSVAVIYSTIHAPTWVRGACTAKKPLTLNNGFHFILNGEEMTFSQAKLKYQGDIVAAVNSKKVTFKLLDDKSKYGGHAVNIVGYNEKGFIIKNSWGKDWADSGYGYISYDLHRLTCTEALAITDITLVKPKRNINPNSVTEFYLKSTLSHDVVSKKKNFQLSIFTSDILADPLITSVTYTIYGRNGKEIARKTQLAPLNMSEYDNSFAVEFFDNALIPTDLLFGKPVNVTAEIYSDANQGKRVYYFNDIYFKTAEYKSEKFKKISNLLQLNTN